MTFKFDPNKYEGHTEGKYNRWFLSPMGDIYAIDDDGDDIVICEVDGRPSISRDAQYTSIKNDKQQLKANSRLIADAPDILTHCVKLEAEKAELIEASQALKAELIEAAQAFIDDLIARYPDIETKGFSCKYVTNLNKALEKAKGGE